MSLVNRLLCLISILALSACGNKVSPPTSSGSTASTAPSVSTAVTASTLNSVPLNNSTTVEVAFSVANGGSATALTVTTGLSSLPSGWSVASPSFSCASVNTANACDLTLTYDPSKAGVSGTLTLGFTYLNSQGKQQQGSVGIPYSSAAANSVTASVAPTGPVQGIVGTTNTLSVTFASGDGTPVTNLALVTDTGTLPSGWSVQSSALPCATVTSAGSCQLQLAYAPTAAAASSTLTLDFSYTDDAGAARTGSVAIAYSAVMPGAVTATATPANASATYIGSTAAVGVVFSATGGAATNLQITSALPTGWTLAGGTLPCAQVSSGSTCQATLDYAPSATTSALTLVLQYAYTDNFGEARTGQLSIPYSAVPHMAYITDTGTGSNSVTQCALDATGLPGNCTQFTSPLFDTPAGIAIDGARAYITQAGTASVSVCNAGPSGLSGCANAVTLSNELSSIVFDGNIAFLADQGGNDVEQCTVDSDGTLSGCAIAAAITPLLSTVNLMSFNDSTLYMSNGGSSNVTTCSVTAGVISTCLNTAFSTPVGKVAFGGTSAYVTLFSQNTVQRCSIGSGGPLTACVDSGVGAIFDGPIGITLFGGYAYVLNRSSNTISQCTVGASGQLTACVNAGTGLNSPFDIAIQ